MISGNGQGTIAYDGKQTIPALISFSQIKELKCGKSYRIILKPGNGSVDIPEFTFANNGTEDEYRFKTLKSIKSRIHVEGTFCVPWFPRIHRQVRLLQGLGQKSAPVTCTLSEDKNSM